MLFYACIRLDNVREAMCEVNTHGVVAQTARSDRRVFVLTSMYHVTVVSKHWPRTVAGEVGLWPNSVEMIDSCR